MAEDFEDFLEHHGVKGMHWGVRRATGKDGLVEKGSADHEKTQAALAKYKTSGTRSLSNEELRLVSNRLNAERDFHRLRNEQERANRSPGRKIIDALLGTTGEVIQREASNQAKSMTRDLVSKAGKMRTSKPKPMNVNPDKVKFTRTEKHNLPDLLRAK